MSYSFVLISIMRRTNPTRKNLGGWEEAQYDPYEIHCIERTKAVKCNKIAQTQTAQMTFFLTFSDGRLSVANLSTCPPLMYGYMG